MSFLLKVSLMLPKDMADPALSVDRACECLQKNDLGRSGSLQRQIKRGALLVSDDSGRMRYGMSGIIWN